MCVTSNRFCLQNVRMAVFSLSFSLSPPRSFNKINYTLGVCVCVWYITEFGIGYEHECVSVRNHNVGCRFAVTLYLPVCGCC